MKQRVSYPRLAVRHDMLTVNSVRLALQQRCSWTGTVDHHREDTSNESTMFPMPGLQSYRKALPLTAKHKEAKEVEAFGGD